MYQMPPRWRFILRTDVCAAPERPVVPRLGNFTGDIRAAAPEKRSKKPTSNGSSLRSSKRDGAVCARGDQPLVADRCSENNGDCATAAPNKYVRSPPARSRKQ